MVKMMIRIEGIMRTGVSKVNASKRRKQRDKEVECYQFEVRQNKKKNDHRICIKKDAICLNILETYFTLADVYKLDEAIKSQYRW